MSNYFKNCIIILKIDNQSIPIWFSTERTLSNCRCEIQKKGPNWYRLCAVPLPERTRTFDFTETVGRTPLPSLTLL